MTQRECRGCDFSVWGLNYGTDDINHPSTDTGLKSAYYHSLIRQRRAQIEDRSFAAALVLCEQVGTLSAPHRKHAKGYPQAARSAPLDA